MDMDEKDIDTQFSREPWRRLLQAPGDEPPETTDARIRAAARRDLAPRGHRGWLPISLAASFVLAVFIVQSQFGTLRRPVAADSAVGPGGAMDARIIERERAEENREPGRAPAAASKRAAPVREESQDDDYGYEESEFAADAAGAGPRIGGPERELKAASELQEDYLADRPAPPLESDLPAAAAPAAPSAERPAAERDLGEITVTGSRQRRDERRSAVPGVAAEEIAAQGLQKSETPPTPEVWYAAIEKLRADGRHDRAKRELERLEQAHPGWLAKHHPNDAPR